MQWIVLILIGVVGAFVYYNLPSTKYEKACGLVKEKKYLEALEILLAIVDKHPGALIKIAEIKYAQGLEQKNKNKEAAKSFFNQIIDLSKKVPSHVDQKKIQAVLALACFEIAEMNYLEFKDKTPSKSQEALIKQNIQYIDQAKQTDIKQKFSYLRSKHLCLLSIIYFDYGVKSEKAGSIADAIIDYKKSLDYATQSSELTVKIKAKCRIGICKLKSNQPIDSSDLSEIQKAYKPIQHDFYFRYAIRLIEEEDYDQAEALISDHFDSTHRQVSSLREIIHSKRQAIAIQKVEEINGVLDVLYNKSFPVDKVMELYNDLDDAIELTEEILPDVSAKIEHFKPGLFNRLLSNFINEKQFDEAINLIQEYPDFWNNVEMIKNLGICCYNFVSQGKLTEANYELIISSWLTALYSDNVILNSLDDTEWDDEYTFTLIDSIGSYYEIHEDYPDNVNRDEVSDSNISIGSTQRELMHQFEVMLNAKVSDSQALSRYQDFYENEKRAIELVIATLTNDTLFAGPTFAKTYGIHGLLIELLEEDYAQYNDEESLVAGIPYLKDKKKSTIGEFVAIKEVLDKVAKGIEKVDATAIGALDTPKNRKLLNTYEGLKEGLQQTYFNNLARRISIDNDNENLIYVMEAVIKFCPENNDLKYQYSDYVANFCLGRVNGNRMKNYDALVFMKDAYFYSDDVPRVSRNLIALIRMNLFDILNKNTNKGTAIFKVLDEIHQKRSMTFISLTDELRETRKEILNDLQNAGHDITFFEDNAFANRRAPLELNADGLMLKKVLGYFAKLGSLRS